MDAFFARNRLSAYLDGELTQNEAREVEAALARDTALKAEFEDLRRAVEMLRDEGLVEPPAGFGDRVRAKTLRQPMPLGWRRWARQIRFEPILLAAAAMLVVVYVGHRKDLPELAAPGEEVATAGAFVKDEPVEAPEVLPDGAAPAVQVENDGVLGNEVAAAGREKGAFAKQQSMAPPKIKGSSLEKEQWQPDWEKEGQAAENAPGYDNNSGNYGGSPENTAGAAAGNTAAPQVQFYSPAPFRYRVAAKDERGLKQLEAIAKELGGELQDSRGGRVAAWLLEEGDSRKLRVVVPAYNAAALSQRLREIGEVETIKESETLVKDANTDIPVQVDVSF